MDATTLHRPILLIDDNDEDLFLIKRLLARTDLKRPIVTVDSGEEAIVFLRACALPGAGDLLPWVVFCDIRMPKVDGFEVVKWARSQPPFAITPFIMLSGGNVPEDREKATAVGANHFLVKFPSADDLRKVVETFGK
jgi:CheY-like chemotaxis protein